MFNKAFSKENKFQDEFVAILRMYGAYAVSITGNIYQSGQPDLSVVGKLGGETKVENKVYRGLDLPYRDAIIGLLKGPQINVIKHQLWPRKANCIIIAQIAAKPDTVCIVSAERFSIDKVENVAKVLAHLPYGAYTPYQ